MKLLSIAVPTYNMEKYLSNCIDSMLGDKPDDRLEIIIVNDGSKDSSIKIAEGYKVKYPNIVRIIDKENGGYGSTINASVKIAEGKYYRVVDSDDAVNVDDLKRLLDKLAKAEADMIVTDYTQFYDDSNTTNYIKATQFNENTKYNLKTTQLKERIPMHMAYFKTELIKDISILEHCFYVDVDYVASCVSRCSSLEYYALNVYQYRLGRMGQSVSLEGYYKHLNDMLLVAKSLVEKASSNKDNNYCYIEAMALLKTLYSLLITFYNKNHETKRFMKELDVYIKNQSIEIYKASNSVMRFKVIWIIRHTGYFAMGLFCILKKIIKG